MVEDYRDFIDFKMCKTLVHSKFSVIDLCKHNFEEFKTELGDIHLSFDMESINEMAQRNFSRIEIKKLEAYAASVQDALQKYSQSS